MFAQIKKIGHILTMKKITILMFNSWENNVSVVWNKIRLEMIRKRKKMLIFYFIKSHQQKKKVKVLI
jgi:hypothetical protein